MEGRVDSRVTGRFGQSGKCLSSRQCVAARSQRRACRGSPRRRLSVEAVAAEAEVWLWVVLSCEGQARAQQCQQPDSCSSCTDSSSSQHGGGCELSKYPPSLSLSRPHTRSERERLINYPLVSVYRWKRQRGQGRLLMACCFPHSLLLPPLVSLQTCLASPSISCTLRE